MDQGVCTPLEFGTVPVQTLYSHHGRIPHAEIRRRAVETLDRGPSAARLVDKFSGKLIIAGGGPSLADTLPDIRRQLRVSKKTHVAAVNRTHDWLLKRGLKPDFGVMIDPKPWVANYMTPTKGVTYCLGAKVHQGVWDRFKGHSHTYHWHPLELAEERDDIAHGTDWLAVPGQSTVGLRSVPLGFCLGFRKFELHGLDCNKRDNAGHAYEKFTADERRIFNPESDLGNQIFYIKSATSTRFYEGTTHMARQCGEFQNMIKEFRILEAHGQEPSDIRVAGHSAMGYLAAIMGLHVNNSYNDNPDSMPMTGALDPNDIEINDPVIDLKVEDIEYRFGGIQFDE